VFAFWLEAGKTCFFTLLNNSSEDISREYSFQRGTEAQGLVLDKETTGLDKTKYRVHMYFTKSGYRKCAPISSIIHLNQDKTVSSTVVSEITAAPLGFLLYFNPTDARLLEGIDISSFADVGYDQIGNISLYNRLPKLLRHSHKTEFISDK